MSEEKKTMGQEVASFLRKFKEETNNKLDKIIKNQQYIKADTTEIGRLLKEFYRQGGVQNVPVVNKGYTGQFVIKNMSDAQAKDLMVRQNVPPQVVARLSDNKFTVQYLVSLVQK